MKYLLNSLLLSLNIGGLIFPLWMAWTLTAGIQDYQILYFAGILVIGYPVTILFCTKIMVIIHNIAERLGVGTLVTKLYRREIPQSEIFGPE